MKSLIKMKFNQWIIIVNLILILYLVRPTVSIPATISDEELFSPTTQGETWERKFHLEGDGRYIVYFQMGAYSKLNITISLDPINTLNVAPYSVLGSIDPPQNYSLNNNPSILSSRRVDFSLTDEEKFSYLVTSSIHLGIANIILAFDTWNNSYSIPAKGVSGEVTIHVLDLGLQDNSLYRTDFRLNSNQSSFEFEFESEISLGDTITTYGREAELKAVVTSASNSTGSVCLNLSESYFNFYSDGSFPQNYSTLQSMFISPGITTEQIFIYDNDDYSYYVHVPFSLSLLNTSTSAWGNISIHLHKLGKQKPEVTDTSTFGMFLGFFVFVVIVRKKTKAVQNKH